MAEDSTGERFVLQRFSPQGDQPDKRGVDTSGSGCHDASDSEGQPMGRLRKDVDPRADATRRMAQMAMRQWAKTQTTPRRTQHEDAEFKADVKSGYSRRYDVIVTDVLIYDKRNKKEHYHLIIDENGRELSSQWRNNH